MSIIHLCRYCMDTDYEVKKFDEFGNQGRASRVRGKGDIYLCKNCVKKWKKEKKVEPGATTAEASKEFSAWLRSAPKW